MASVKLGHGAHDMGAHDMGAHDMGAYDMNVCAGAKPQQPVLSSPFVRQVEAFFVRYQKHVAIVHVLMFFGFLALVLGPLFLPDPPENAGIFGHFATFANFAMWGLWFPLVFLSVIFSGRSWCGLLCPMGAASEWANRHGLQREIPRWVRWEGTPIISFLIITILGQTVGVRDHPEAIAEVFGGTMLAAIALGFVYCRNNRAWCRHSCPIGLLPGAFSPFGSVPCVPQSPGPWLYP